MPEHLTETVSRTVQFSSITLAMKGLHRIFDDIDLVEELRDRLTELYCIRPARGLGIHCQHVGTKAVLFKALSLAAQAFIAQADYHLCPTTVSTVMACRRWRR
jgi:hypothetical protein